MELLIWRFFSKTQCSMLLHKNHVSKGYKESSTIQLSDQNLLFQLQCNYREQQLTSTSQLSTHIRLAFEGKLFIPTGAGN